MIKVDKRSLVVVLTVAFLLARFVAMRPRLSEPCRYFAREKERTAVIEAESARSPQLLYTATYVQGGVKYSVKVPNLNPPIPSEDIHEYACGLMASRVGPGLDEDFRDRVEIKVEVLR